MRHIMTQPAKNDQCLPAKTQISLHKRAVWRKSSLCAQLETMAPRFLQVNSEDWWDWVGAQADLGVRWAPRSFCWLCRAVALHYEKPIDLEMLKKHMSHHMTKLTKSLCAQRRLRSAWASAQSDQSSLCVQWLAKDPSFLPADSEDSDQTGRMPRLIGVFAGRTVILLVLSCRGSYCGNITTMCFYMSYMVLDN